MGRTVWIQNQKNSGANVCTRETFQIRTRKIGQRQRVRGPSHAPAIGGDWVRSDPLGFSGIGPQLDRQEQRLGEQPAPRAAAVERVEPGADACSAWCRPWYRSQVGPEFSGHLGQRKFPFSYPGPRSGRVAWCQHHQPGRRWTATGRECRLFSYRKLFIAGCRIIHPQLRHVVFGGGLTLSVASCGACTLDTGDSDRTYRVRRGVTRNTTTRTVCCNPGLRWVVLQCRERAFGPAKQFLEGSALYAARFE